ncbi:cholesterol esterase [Catenulispora sp. NF23]|uniref:Cholesterol esterase n=1 Tax=Catenulispora pinistramenti TaxID=2705254 RepID=A0ABS5KTX0_9ACTN|nr:DUF6230 family protein [Catenulispora pinistramenti]MBS2535090.1 cholesterol esterase [Catenulispora pinistramenti]MBS2549501.1 cholesterol esterase [Catenulispora pinistramenti]
MATKPGKAEGKVRYRRAAIPGLAALAITGGLVMATAQGALGVQFAISGMPFVVTADHLHGQNFEQFGGLDNALDSKNPWLKSSNGQAVVMTSVIGDAQITNLCQSVNLVGINLVIRAGNKGTPVHATNLILDSTDLSGDATFQNIQIGRDASNLSEDQVVGNKYTFGQQADTVDIDNVRQDSYATTASTFSLPGLNMSFQSKGC